MTTTTKRPTKKQVVQSLTDAMDSMQANPELEEADTLSLMEDAISEALEYFTGQRRTTREEDAAHQEEDYANDPRTSD